MSQWCEYLTAERELWAYLVSLQRAFVIFDKRELLALRV